MSRTPTRETFLGMAEVAKLPCPCCLRAYAAFRGRESDISALMEAIAINALDSLEVGG